MIEFDKLSIHKKMSDETRRQVSKWVNESKDQSSKRSEPPAKRCRRFSQ